MRSCRLREPWRTVASAMRPSQQRPRRPPTGTPTIDQTGGMPTSGLRAAAPSAAPSSTQPSVGAQHADRQTRSTRPAPIQTPGIEPIRMLPISAKSTLPATTCASAGGPQQDRGVEDVGADDAVRREAEEQDQRRAPISAPEPTEVMPRTKPSTSAERDGRRSSCRASSATVLALARRGATNSARASIDQRRRSAARPRRSVSSDVVEVLPNGPEDVRARTTPSDARRAREPNASHFDTPMSTVPASQWRQPPTVFVTAP